jgi:membrane-associated phospholipid phosphatase
VLRVAFGGHFSSDVIFAALFTLLLVVGLHARLLRAEGQGLRPRDPHL